MSFRIAFTSRAVGLLVFQFSALFFTPSVLAENIVSRPVGFVRLTVAEQPRLVALPFTTTNASIDCVVGDQLTGFDNNEASDRILKWDPLLPGYVRAYKADGTGNFHTDGNWFSDIAGRVPSDMTLSPGEGFWIENRQGVTQQVFLTGNLIMDPTNEIVLLPSLNLVGYSYSSSRALEETDMGALVTEFQEDGDRLVDPLSDDTSDQLKLARGYWYERRGEAVAWAEARPYANVFPQAGTPAISAFTISGGGTAITLSVECEGCEGESLDIYYRDVDETTRVDIALGWKIAEADLPTHGTTYMEWVDFGSVDRKPVNEVFARYYLVARADIDSDANGIPDAREVFLLGRSIESFASGKDDDTESIVADSAPPVEPSATEQDGTNVAASVPVMEYIWLAGRIIYVDQERGSDGLSGRAPIILGDDGPTKTIKAGLATARAGDRVIIRSGDYGEHINIAGRDVSVRIKGKVDLTRRQSDVPGVPGEPEPGIVTNAVTGSP